MPITTKVELRPFTVPTHVTVVQPPGKRQDGFKEAPKIAIRDLDDETLTQLCDEFRQAVFALKNEVKHVGTPQS